MGNRYRFIVEVSVDEDAELPPNYTMDSDAEWAEHDLLNELQDALINGLGHATAGTSGINWGWRLEKLMQHWEEVG